MSTKSKRVCPVENAGGLDNKLRKLVHNPQKILGSHISSGMTVLDFGCGPGFFTIEIAKMLNGSGKVIAADLQKGMLDLVQKKIEGTGFEKNIMLHQCSDSGIGLEEKVDFVLAFYVVHELPDPESWIIEVRSMLKPGGKVLIVEPKFHVPKPSFKKMAELMVSHGLKIIDRPGIIMSRAILCQS